MLVFDFLSVEYFFWFWGFLFLVWCLMVGGVWGCVVFVVDFFLILLLMFWVGLKLFVIGWVLFLFDVRIFMFLLFREFCFEYVLGERVIVFLELIGFVFMGLLFWGKFSIFFFEGVLMYFFFLEWEMNFL